LNSWRFGEGRSHGKIALAASCAGCRKSESYPKGSPNRTFRTGEYLTDAKVERLSDWPGTRPTFVRASASDDGFCHRSTHPTGFDSNIRNEGVPRRDANVRIGPLDHGLPRPFSRNRQARARRPQRRSQRVVARHHLDRERVGWVEPTGCRAFARGALLPEVAGPMTSSARPMAFSSC
jgi:hypothetical protein